jgi:hypothetical protein
VHYAGDLQYATIVAVHRVITGAGVLDANNYQGKFGQDYVRVLASAAGLTVWTPDLDYDGIDLGIRWPGRVGSAASPAIDGLNELQFNNLAGQAYTTPRYLFLVVVPKKNIRYAEISPEGMLLRYQGYYVSLRDEALIQQPSRNRRRVVHVPVGNVLTTGTLRGLMHPDLAGHGVPHGGSDR